MSCLSCAKGVSKFHSDNLFTWCTNCGNYGINASVKRALASLGYEPHQVVLFFDIGCNGNGSDKIEGYTFHGLHGRVIPLACGASIANKDVPIIASAGDGATLSEGINHLIHAIRNNYNITFLLHNNENYALTTGQASSTTPKGAKRSIAPDGSLLNPIHVGHLALNLGASFYARGYSGDVNHLTEIIKAGILHKGFSFIEIMQDCPTYNKEMTHDWYRSRIYNLDAQKSHDRSNLTIAYKKASDMENKIATGIIYQNKDIEDFLTIQPNRKGYTSPLIDEVRSYENISLQLFEDFK